jgi:regulator of sirC expression with transglutaminase-like and TPR domain
MRRISQLIAAAGVLAAMTAAGAEPETAPSVKDLVARVGPAIVVISYAGRDGSQEGLGTGFVIDERGLVATNLHVIGEARPISVQTAEGKTLAVKAVHASDRALDLAILEVEGSGLAPLELASGQPAAGEAVVLMGNPRGLKHSVVTGVVSGTRDLEGRTMLQLAVPVEPGNSGGPVLDMQGRVLGIMTMKSAVTENLGFAVAAKDLLALREKPNPVPIERWLTIGAIDRSQWEPLFGARWQQRGGRIVVDGVGAGFGGRSLLLAKTDVPEAPFEVAVSVKLNDESGAAGLVFHSDGGHKHYGFYPSNGRLRLSRFEGSDVFSWQVLVEKPSEHYRPGDWNRLKVRVEKDRIQCFVNEELVIESNDRGFSRGRVGLAKFRGTAGEFRLFAVGSQVPAERLDEMSLADLKSRVARLPPLSETSQDTISELARHDVRPVGEVLHAQIRELEQRAAELKKLAADVHTSAVAAELGRLAGPEAESIDLLRAALTIARLDEEDLDVEAYVKHVERMASEVKAKLGSEATEGQKLAALNDFLFQDSGFHGSRTDYYHRANSYLSRVIDDREGLPITLSVLYMELGSRLGLRIEGVGLPGHFVVRHVPQEGEVQLVDVFEGGQPLSRKSAEQRILAMTGEPARREHFDAAAPRAILQRILMNLISIAQDPKKGVDREALIRYESAMLALDPTLVRDRGLRAVCRWETGRVAAAVDDLQVLIDAKPAELDVDELRKMQEYFRTSKPAVGR